MYLIACQFSEFYEKIGKQKNRTPGDAIVIPK